MRHVKTFLIEKWVNLVILCIVALGGWFRITAYGPFQLSVGMVDTPSFVSSSTAPLFSASMFTSRRLFTSILLFKLAGDPLNCKLENISVPTDGIQLERTQNNCFDKIVFLQNVMSVLSWSFLAIITSRWLKHPVNKILAVSLILAFGYTPQIAEWDSVLSSESLSLSLFALFFGLLQEAFFRSGTVREKQWPSLNRFLLASLAVILILWVFVRDVHLYSLLITIVVLLPLLFISNYRNKIGITSVVIGLLVIYLLGSYSARSSTRWQLSLEHVLDGYIFPYPARVDFFIDNGMPEDRSTKRYTDWFESQGIGTYGKFLVLHPGFVLATLMDRIDYFKSDFVQPYFTTSEVKHRDLLLLLGESLHPETLAVYLIDALLLLSFMTLAYKQSDATVISWSWLAIWLFAYAGVSLLLSFFGDTDGTRRHIFPSVECFRLFLWIFVFAIMDVAIAKSNRDTINTTLVSK